MPIIRILDRRHTCASLLLLAKKHPSEVADLLGHASVVITLTTYSHILPPNLSQRVAEAMDTLLMKRVERRSAAREE